MDYTDTEKATRERRERERTLEKRRPGEEEVDRGRGEEELGRVGSTDDLEASVEEADEGSRVPGRLRPSFDFKSDFSSCQLLGFDILVRMKTRKRKSEGKFGWRRRRNLIRRLKKKKKKKKKRLSKEKRIVQFK